MFSRGIHRFQLFFGPARDYNLGKCYETHRSYCVSVRKASDSRQPGILLPGSFRKEVISEILFY